MWSVNFVTSSTEMKLMECTKSEGFINLGSIHELTKVQTNLPVGSK